MPTTIENPILYHDRTVQDWHRTALPSSFMAIDLDLMGVCPSCKTPLYVIESTTNPNKPLSILRRLAEISGMFGIVVFHDCTAITSWRVVHDPTSQKTRQNFSNRHESALADLVSAIRSHHVCGCGIQ